MKKMYHATKFSNLWSILDNGLKPGVDGLVYLAETREEAFRFICIRVFNEPILVLEVEVNEAELQETFDHSFSFFKCRAFGYPKVIPCDVITQMWKYGGDA